MKKCCQKVKETTKAEQEKEINELNKEAEDDEKMIDKLNIYNKNLYKSYEQLQTKLKENLKIVDKKIKQVEKIYKLTKPPKELDHLNVYQAQLKVLKDLKKQLRG